MQIIPLNQILFQSSAGVIPQSSIVELSSEQASRAQRLLDESLIISLHDHAFVVPEDTEQIFEYRRAGRDWTGYEGLEALTDSSIVVLALKAATNRQRPTSGDHDGAFWEGGKSFPSGHAATSFAFASVIAHRYPDKRWLKWSAYGLATGVSLVRLAGKRHFPSDTLVGATVGYITGTYLAKHADD